MRRPELFITSLLLIFSMGLAACTSEAPATSVVMPEMLATMTEEADLETCADLQGTNQVEMDIQIMDGEAQIQGCVDPALHADSLTILFIEQCRMNEDLATCSFPIKVEDTGYFAGTSKDIAATTPKAAAAIVVDDTTTTCGVMSIDRGLDKSSGKITFDCPVSAGSEL